MLKDIIKQYESETSKKVFVYYNVYGIDFVEWIAKKLEEKQERDAYNIDIAEVKQNIVNYLNNLSKAKEILKETRNDDKSN